MMWTLFWDMHSGGGSKEGAYEKIYIEAAEAEARVIFYNRFNHSPDRVSCTCCGPDYAVSEYESLEQASAYHRGCRYAYKRKSDGKEVPQKEAWVSGKGLQPGYTEGYVEDAEPRRSSFLKYRTLAQYIKGKDVLVIRESTIKPSERVGEIPEQGYVWKD